MPQRLLPLSEHTWDFIVGLFFAALAACFLLLINDYSIDTPVASYQAESAAITPAFFPNWVCGAILVFSLGLMASSWSRMRWDQDHQEAVAYLKYDRLSVWTRASAMAVLLALYFVADWLGIVLAGFIFYLLFALFSGERRAARALIGACLTTGILYYLFVEAANVPLPLGVLDVF